MTASEEAPQRRRNGPEGFEEFFRRYEPMVQRYLWLVADGDDRQDIAQETMASALQYWDRVSKMDPPTGWVFKVATQRMQRERAQAGRAGIPTDPVTLHDKLLHPDPATGSDRQIDTLRAISRLPTMQRNVVALRYFVGLPDSEIAKALGIAPETVRTHALHARVRLARMLGDYAGGADA